MVIRAYTAFHEEEIRRLYADAGWTAYTEDLAALRRGFEGSLLVLGAYEGEELLGLIRAVGDGHTVVFIQDLLVRREEQRKGIGTALVKALLSRYPRVRQIELAADRTPETTAFYRSLGFRDLNEFGCCGYMLTRREKEEP